MSKHEMREPTFLVLSALADGPKHGYALIAETKDLSGGRVKLQPGTLYGVLDRLREDGLVEISGEDVVDGRARRYYRITDGGAATLAKEADRLAANARQAMSKLRLRAAQAGA
ncbi:MULTISPECIES: PadR family transcriptional regulator [unclassified Arthrobacter]|uniref:PadR family transcriptional regulator n=1 Tax=unclassified Arthrobacter TaxID=235627 RepID=UPI001D139A39|nr:MULTISPECIES: PadR family transcriptional regulator [unclassified Arthrobacter]MCC3289840.1 PadR family transcriptional regulator [Arthrobacter sp. zg-Y1110]MCC3300657.1 PadR family transcriptional regulator [Arthrobacter sp. zg-Y895]MCQ1946033.1 PadR family transcriptional regulator [Arthrobacter sp. zg-Y1116]MCQ1985971.1 PadR family transcriptional regulator [Arthrobacter sp. zg-Y844]MCQ1994287.1 PadR family transcriptional regulator [Arthrobacter sp. zg-Y1171]